ncbi:PNGase F N-terminal domain-containing protein [Salinimicrobium sp. 3283s]|uniref:PNGase F N-terminal domain-containing protein n=1 Tax=Salinimicrobium sp. 3283s TaxID=3114359 RepID=UPI0031E76758
MKNIKSLIRVGIILLSFSLYGQKTKIVEVFKNQPVNFTGIAGDTVHNIRLQDGRIIYKKIKAPDFEKGTDVFVHMTLRSAGDTWDKSGSLFVITDPEKIDIIDIAEGKANLPEAAGIPGYQGIKKGGEYNPALEILRFMTPFGVGHYSDEQKNPRIKYNRPVYVPKWEEEVKWTEDISHLSTAVTGEFIVGVWIDTWTSEGYLVDVELEYSGRAAKKKKVLPLVNTVYYASQTHPDLFSEEDLTVDFKLPKNVKNAKLHYITTGHGGHSGGDEFIKLHNTVKINNEILIDTIPWRDDCASFRRFNPTSGVWVRKDTAFAYNENREKEYIEIKERLASSDLSRSNWCPGSKVSPMVKNIGNLQKGQNQLTISIDGTPIDGDKLNHWLVSAYITYEEN